MLESFGYSFYIIPLKMFECLIDILCVYYTIISELLSHLLCFVSNCVFDCLLPLKEEDEKMEVDTVEEQKSQVEPTKPTVIFLS